MDHTVYNFKASDPEKKESTATKAETALPTIKPTIKRVIESRTRQATKLTSKSMAPAPKMPASATIHELSPKAEIPKAVPDSISKATPKPAPELTPST
jgi:hypothetical protein